jgi:hypothetical protein
MFKTYKTFGSIGILIVSIGVFYYFYSQTGVQSAANNLKVGSKESLQREKMDTRALQLGNIDEYGFPREVDLNVFGYEPGLIKKLYSEDGYTYSIHSRETGGNMPIVKEGLSTKEYAGLTAGAFSSFSVDNRYFVHVTYDYAIEQSKLCIVRISPKNIKCTLSKPGESFVRGQSDSGVLLHKGAWVTEDTFEYVVFKNSYTPGAYYIENSHELRKEKISI